jgi:7-cyano-7-deazaguanine synthase in queuosine biosynthesis
MDENFVSIFQNSLDRGRDYSNVFYRKGSWICNHRAVPTTEIENAEFNQPFGTDYKVVHNGTISNDKELGNPEGMIDSYILSKVLDFTSLTALRDSLQKIVGSYAIGIMKPNGTFYLACNYKPIFYSYHEGEFYFSSYRNHLPSDWNVVHMKPYSVFDSETGESLDIPRTVFDHCIVIASGGLDSTAVAAYACHKHKKVTLLHFNYGCIAEDRELELIKKISEELSSRNPECDVTLDVVNLDLPFMKNASTLFGSNDDIVEGIAGSEYAHEWVPARNLMMMSIAVAYAESKDASYIYLGTNLEEGGCLSGDTLVKLRKNQNYKDCTLQELYEGWVSDDDTNFINTQGELTIRTMFPDGTLRYVPIENVYCTGNKPLLQITLEDGSVIKTSTEHEFFTLDGYKQSKYLTLNDSIYCNGKRYSNMSDEEYQEWKRKLSVAKQGDKNPNKIRENRDKITITNNLKFGSENVTENGYIYVGGMSFHPYCTAMNKVYKHRLVVEALLNNMSYEDWVHLLRTNAFTGSEVFLDPDMEVHHIDGNTLNNDIENLEVLSKVEHAKTHTKENIESGKCYPMYFDVCTPKKIVSIEQIGEEVTYDISVRGTHNYVANGFIGHNSYPDNENQFIKDFDSCLYGAVQNGKYVHVGTPVGNLMKHEIVKFGLKYNAPFEYTWSCYRDGEKACGHCGPCFMRQTAFQRNGMVDPIQYEKPKVKYESNNN